MTVIDASSIGGLRYSYPSLRWLLPTAAVPSALLLWWAASPPVQSERIVALALVGSLAVLGGRFLHFGPSLLSPVGVAARVAREDLLFLGVLTPVFMLAVPSPVAVLLVALAALVWHRAGQTVRGVAARGVLFATLAWLAAWLPAGILLGHMVHAGYDIWLLKSWRNWRRT